MPKKSLAVVGLGYVGLPLAVLAAKRGWRVVGFDVDAQKARFINQKKSPFVDDGLGKDLRRYPIAASTDPAIVRSAQVIVVAVPTPVTRGNLPDLRPLTSALTSILPHLAAGQTLVIESTINPGVMDEIVVPLLAQRRDLLLDATSKMGRLLYLAHCPERINPGDTTWRVQNIPRVLGGYSRAGLRRARAFYESILDAPVKVMGSVTEAEAVKILENTFRDVNIAFINEMAKSFDKLGINIMNVIAGASTKPFAFLLHYPGNGVGGHCISVDPYYMIERARQVGFDHEFLKLARHINDSMPAYAVTRLEMGLKRLGKNLKSARVALLGLSYKKNIADLRESPALEILRILHRRARRVHVFDPFVPEQSTVTSLAEALKKSDVVMLACDHDRIIRALTPAALTRAGIKLIVDGKNALNAPAIAKVGILYYGIGCLALPMGRPAKKQR